MEKIMTRRYNNMRIEVKSSPETLQPQCGTCRLALQKSPHCEHLLIFDQSHQGEVLIGKLAMEETVQT